MCYQIRHAAGLLCACVALLLPARALAWVETAVRSHAAVVDVDRSGKAVVSHELVLKVRGGPLEHLRLDGVDSDAELLPDATVAQVQSGVEVVHPLLTELGEDGSLLLEIDAEKGLRTGLYLFKFRYRTHLLERDLLVYREGAAHLRWIGPRFDSGVDSPRVTFRVPPAPQPPSLPRIREAANPLGFDGDTGGVLVSELRRAHDKDELELIRAHLAKGEPAVWQAQVSPSAFDAFAPAVTPRSVTPLPDTHTVRASRSQLIWVLGCVLIAALYGAWVAVKWSCLNKAAALRSSEPRALLPLAIGPRAALSGALLAGAVAVAVMTELATLAAALLVCSMLCAACISPRARRPLRGPGQWLPISDEEAFEIVASPKLPGRFFDAGTWPGFLIFIVLLSGFVGISAYLFRQSPYDALLLALFSACLLPIFCTGRAGELPPDPAVEPKRVLMKLAEGLRKAERLKVVPIARIPDGASVMDELRLLVVPRPLPRGLLAIEVGLEHQMGYSGNLLAPCVIVRAADDSPTYHALPRHISWTRGRSAEERVAIIRPKLPNAKAGVALVQRLVDKLSASKPGASKLGASKLGASKLGAAKLSAPMHRTGKLGVAKAAPSTQVAARSAV